MLSRAPVRRVVDVLRGLSDASGLDADKFRERLSETVGDTAARKLQAVAGVERRTVGADGDGITLIRF
jgi:hypothetical protein